MTNVQKLEEDKQKILSSIRFKGPSLPVQISKTIGVEPIFASAFLSELKAENKVKISNLRVGSSPLYYLSGQESMLENFSEHLNQREKEALSLLKDKKVLSDEDQTPVIRVALRAIKDFAIPKKVKIRDSIKLYWKYFLISDEQIPSLLSFQNPISSSKQPEPTPQTEKKESKIEDIFESKHPQKPKPHIESPKPPISEFTDSLKSFLQKNNISITKEISQKRKDFSAIISLDNEFGKQSYFLIAKDKKSVSDNDLTLCWQKAQEHKMPALFISPGKLTKKALLHIEEWSNLIKFLDLKS